MEETDSSSSSEDSLPLAQYFQPIEEEHLCLELSDQEQSEQQIEKVVKPIAHKEEDLREVENVSKVHNLTDRFATIEKEHQICSENHRFQNDLFDGHKVPDVHIEEIVEHQLDKFKDNLTDTVDKTSQTVEQIRQQLGQAK
uniref:Uncharacterized protein n=1 Tax=Timema monikensis TaxID=170555 RepID=A0A7R9EJ43_9NEOP|nr:unnamed protein product [Timema monikensis]